MHSLKSASRIILENKLYDRGYDMKIVNVNDIAGTKFPAGRHTRVVVGDNGALQGEHFAQGYVVVYPGGGIPEHEHEMEETYFIISGNGMVAVGSETRAVTAGDLVLIESGLAHSLNNIGETDMVMMFVYSPKTIAEHWEQELSGKLH